MNAAVTYQEHALVQPVRPRLGYQVVGRHLVLLHPFVLHLELSQSLGSRQRRLEAVHSASKVVLALVKHLFRLENLEDPSLPVQTLGRVQKCREL